MTVVETRIEILLFKKSFSTLSLSDLSNAPCMIPTFLLNFLLSNSNNLDVDEKSNLLESSINGQTQKTCSFSFIFLFINGQRSSILFSGLLNVIIFFLCVGFSVNLDVSMSP